MALLCVRRPIGRRRFRLRLAGQTVVDNDPANLSHLIRLRLCATGLQVQDFLDAVAGEDVVTPTGAFRKPKVPEQSAQVREVDSRVG